MDTALAVAIAEGYVRADSHTQWLEAWQHLVDTGACWELQGWFGRTAKHLIEHGEIRPPAPRPAGR